MTEGVGKGRGDPNGRTRRIRVERGASHTPARLGDTEELLAHALGRATTEHASTRRDYERTRHRTLTRRGVMWLGQTCNLRCHFCYFLDRIEDAKHVEHPFMTLEKAIAICDTLRDFYGNTAIDIQGGEPTLWPHILDLVRHCRSIGLMPTLITNGILLADRGKCEEFRDAGIRDFLVSVHGLGALHDTVVGLEGAFDKQMLGLRNLQEVGIPFRFNCVMSKAATPYLPAIARLAVETGSNAVNFLTFNPFEDQLDAGVRTSENVPRYDEVRGPLSDALDVLEAGGVEGNVRYFPLCMVDERHRKSMYNFKQLSYDHHEWDYASWNWTHEQPQRSRPGETTKPYSLQPRMRTAPTLQGVVGAIVRFAEKRPALLRTMRRGHELVSRAVAPPPSREALYWNNGELRATEHCGYRYSATCEGCDLRRICDGFHGDYAEMFGTDEATSVTDAGDVSHPTHYIARQVKVVELEDEEWALEEPGGEASATE